MEIQDRELEDLDIEIAGRAESRSRMLKIPKNTVLTKYVQIV